MSGRRKGKQPAFFCPLLQTLRNVNIKGSKYPVIEDLISLASGAKGSPAK
jgi:hypothetical protein